MQVYTSIIDATNALGDYATENAATLPDNLKESLKEAVRAISPVDRIVKGMEALYAILTDAEAPDRADGLQVLHGVAMQVAEGGFWGKGDRAVSMVRWSKYEAGEWPDGIDAPEVPEIDPTLTPTPPVVSDEPPPPVEPQGEPQG